MKWPFEEKSDISISTTRQHAERVEIGVEAHTVLVLHELRKVNNRLEGLVWMARQGRTEAEKEIGQARMEVVVSDTH